MGSDVDLRRLPPPPASTSGRWTAAAIVLMVLGGFTVSTMGSAGTTRVLPVVAGGMVAVVSGVLMLVGRAWARWPGLVALVAGLLGVAWSMVDVMREQPGSDAEDMRPIAALGFLMIAGAMVVGIVLLAVTPRPQRAVQANWLRDPVDPLMVRYWDGRAWTEYAQPATALPPPGQPWQPGAGSPGAAGSGWPGPTTWSD